MRLYILEISGGTACSFTYMKICSSSSIRFNYKFGISVYLPIFANRTTLVEVRGRARLSIKQALV